MSSVVVLLTGGWGSDGWGATAYGQDTVPDLPAALATSVGTVSVAGTSESFVTGLEATGGVGTVDATGISTVELTGVTATGEVNALRFDALASFSGWGRGAWGEGAWSSNTSIAAAQGSTGEVTVITNVDVLPSGLIGNSAVGVVNVTGGTGVTVNVTGLEGVPSVGTVATSGDANVSVTGLEATASVGTVTQKTNQNITVTAPAAAIATVNPVAQVICDANVSVTGLEAGVLTPRVLVWGREIPDPGTIWTEIAA